MDQTSDVRVIAQFKQRPSEAVHQRVLQGGGELRNRLGVVKAGAYKVPARELARIGSDPQVAYVSPDRAVRAQLDLSAAAVNASAAWNAGWFGSGVGVAVIDSGTNPVPDLANATGNYQVGYSQDFTGNGPEDSTVMGNTPQVSSPAMAYLPPARGPSRGIAPGANLVDLRVLDQNGESTDSEVITAIDTAIQLKNQYNLRVINLSLGRPVYESYTIDPLCQAVEAAWRAGIVVVVAAGNDGRDFLR